MPKNKLITITVIIAALALMVGMAGYVWVSRQAPAPGTVVTVTIDNFEKEVAGSDIPVFIEFTATWCGYCQQQEPLVEQAAKDYAGKVKFVKIDVDKSPEIASAAGIQGLPTMVVLDPSTGKGVVAVGYLDQEQLKQFIEDSLTRIKP